MANRNQRSRQNQRIDGCCQQPPKRTSKLSMEGIVLAAFRPRKDPPQTRTPSFPTSRHSKLSKAHIAPRPRKHTLLSTLRKTHCTRHLDTPACQQSQHTDAPQPLPSSIPAGSWRQRNPLFCQSSSSETHDTPSCVSLMSSLWKFQSWANPLICQPRISRGEFVK